MLPTDNQYGIWPKSGEIDIMEFVGYHPDSVFGTVHTEAYNGMRGTQKVKGISVNSLSTAFHTYAIEWNEKSISFFVDNQQINYFENDGKGSATWPYDQRFHLILNIAVGGGWGGKNGIDDSIFPQQLLIDYVRVYQ
jgi:beta-glucanase (GH16 family)